MTIQKDARTALGIFAILLALAGFALTLYLNSDQNARFKAERIASQAAAAAVDPVICQLVFAYVHPVAGTDQTHRADQVDRAWQKVGSLVGCPEGTPPKGP